MTYGAATEDGALVLYVMSRRHLRKVRDIAQDPRVSLVIPIARALLTILPPATIQLRGRAELRPQDDPGGVAAFERFLLGRRILTSYTAMRARGDARICFIRIALDRVAHSYMVATSVWRAARDMEAAAATTDLTAEDAPAG